MAKSGFNVKGFDIDKQLVEDLNKYKVPFFEKGISSLLNQQLNKNANILANQVREHQGNTAKKIEELEKSE